MKGIILITGPRGVGKTTLAATFLPPNEVDRVFYHDSESSATRIIEEMSRLGFSFGYYNNLASRFANLPGDDLLREIAEGRVPWTKEQKSALVSYYEYILHDLHRNMERGHFKVYVHDTITKFEASMVAWCDEHARELGVRGSSKGSPWGEFWSAGYYALYEQLFEAIKSRGVETIILVSHLKAASEAGRRVPGKVEPAGKPWLTYQTSLMLWLVPDRNNTDGAPAALVLKERLGRLETDGKSWKPRRMLPERLPRATWEEINRYLEHGCDLSHPAPGERMSDAEREMISEFISDEQMKLMVLGAEETLTANPEPPFEYGDQLERARSLAAAEGIPLPLAIKRLKERGEMHS